MDTPKYDFMINNPDVRPVYIGAQKTRTEKSLRDRFWRHVEIHGDDECWPWLVKHQQSGHGQMHVGERLVQTGRLVFFLTWGRWPDGVARHTCDNPPCCNPAHVIDGTQADNLWDRVERGRHPQQQKTHCPAGHEYSGANLILYHPPGTDPRRVDRICRACKREWAREHRKRA